MIDRESRLDPIDGLGSFKEDRRRIIHKYVKRLPLTEKFCSDRANFFLGREIRQEEFQSAHTRSGTTQIQSRLAAPGIPAKPVSSPLDMPAAPVVSGPGTAADRCGNNMVKSDSGAGGIVSQTLLGCLVFL